MNSNRFGYLIDETFATVKSLTHSKGIEYTDNSKDRLENFKGEGKNLNVSPLVIWSVYASKHFRAIQSYIRLGGKIVSNEPIEGRIDDLILYLLLLKALIEDTDINKPELIEYCLKVHGNMRNLRLTQEEINSYTFNGDISREALARNHLE